MHDLDDAVSTDDAAADGEPYRKPLPRLDGLDAPFWAAARDEQLVVQHCGSCERYQFPASRSCQRCGAAGPEWRTVSGLGVLHTFSVMHRPYHPAWDGETPYAVAVVELDEGPLMVSQVCGDVDELHVGMPLRVMFDPVTPDVTLPRFVRR